MAAKTFNRGLKTSVNASSRYFPSNKSARESTESVRRTSLTRSIFKKHEEKHSSPRKMDIEIRNGFKAAASGQLENFEFRTGPTGFEFEYRTAKSWR